MAFPKLFGGGHRRIDSENGSGFNRGRGVCIRVEYRTRRTVQPDQAYTTET